jgi:hypothetical protein
MHSTFVGYNVPTKIPSFRGFFCEVTLSFLNVQSFLEFMNSSGKYHNCRTHVILNYIPEEKRERLKTYAI